jgi:hypothetical protein
MAGAWPRFDVKKGVSPSTPIERTKLGLIAGMQKLSPPHEQDAQQESISHYI